MQFAWNDEQIAWFVDASVYTGFHNKVARLIRPYLNAGDTVLDMGCGLGLLDLEIASDVRHILAADINETALAALNAQLASRGISNVDTACIDAWQLGGSFDVVLMSYFSYFKGKPSAECPMCKRRLIRITNAGTARGLVSDKHWSTSSSGFADYERMLIETGRKHEAITVELEFGQPLRSRADGVRYICHFKPDSSKAEAEQYLDANATTAVREPFELFLPYKKRVGIFVIDMG